MKKLISSRLFFWLITIAVFFFYLCFVSAAVCAYPLSQQKHQLRTMHHMLSIDYLNDRELHSFSEMDVFLIYSPDRSLIFEARPKMYWSENIPQKILEQLLNKGAGGKESFVFYFEPYENDLIVVLGGPVAGAAAGSECILVARNVKNIPEAIESALMIFALLYWIIAILLSLFIRHRQKYNEMERRYVSNMTHALKGPIASVRALTEALIDVVPADSDAQQPYFGRILKETGYQNHIVSELLDLSGIQSGSVDFSKSRIPAENLFSECFEKYLTICSLSNITFTVSDDIAHLPALKTNADRISSVMEILLENAMKYIEQGEIIIDVRKFRKYAVFSVTNTDGHIEPDDIDHVFERFFSGRNSEGKYSNGLGLSIAKEIMDGLNEKIWITSSPSAGTTAFFTVHF